MGVYYPNIRGDYYKKVENLLEKVNIDDIREIEINDNRLPKGLAKLSQLRKITMNGVKSFPADLALLPHLEELHLRRGAYYLLAETFPFTLALPNLKHLELQKEYYDNMTADSFALLENLEYLSLDGTCLGSFPEKILALKNLKYLYMNATEFDALPEGIEKLALLEELSLNNNGLKKLPKNLGVLKHLKKLTLNVNKLKSLPDSLTQLPELYLLEANNNNLTKLPAAMGNLKQLKVLRMQKNKLTALPDNIVGCTALTTLDLENNKLAQLPEQTGALPNLKTLYLKKNKVLSLPQSLGKLSASAKLDISDNPLNWANFPFEAGDFRELMLRYIYDKITAKNTAALSDQLQHFAPALASHPLQKGSILTENSTDY